MTAAGKSELCAWLEGEGFRLTGYGPSAYRKYLPGTGALYVTDAVLYVHVTVADRRDVVQWTAKFGCAPLPVILSVIQPVLETAADTSGGEPREI